MCQHLAGGPWFDACNDLATFEDDGVAYNTRSLPLNLGALAAALFIF